MDSYFEADENDTFYADLRRQILLLIDDGDEELLQIESRVSQNTSMPSVRPKEIVYDAGLEPSNSLDCWKHNRVPLKQVNTGNFSNGTGVFIPHIVPLVQEYRYSGRNYNNWQKFPNKRIYRPVGSS
ncbi:hypothetical protein IFM89_026454 [Coptis chinensis]|uniref:Uncharacterized protein n=1 Tax=Coptis chinensis TaxID=261450 RepID=A0A835H9A2_9MAGN|nr:hypothetical protein IFM89_016937 [Coptis chinensis]KAF9593958.1 hypothetical protein IFM89_026454 [Coptis chinensis]